jgi:predicted amidohydrolase
MLLQWNSRRLCVSGRGEREGQGPTAWVAGTEPQPPSEAQATELMLANLLVATDLLETIGWEHEARVAVLPEYGLTGPDFPTRASAKPFLLTVPAPGSTVGPCVANDSGEGVIRTASCWARQHRVDLVINVPEASSCTSRELGCPADGWWHFNTMVVFSGASGAVIGRYRKVRLYFEPAFDEPRQPQSLAFNSSFGVAFGMMTCFDIMFASPMVGALGRSGIRDVVYGSWWVNKPPYLTATQVQSGWAWREQVNLIAAGSGESGWFSSGSGVFPFATSGQLSNASYRTDSISPATMVLTRLGLQSSPRQGPLPVYPGAEPQSTNETRPWELAVQPWAASSSSTVARTTGVHCTVATPSGEGNQSYAVMAAQGWYNNLFPTLMCGVCPCPSGQGASCFEELGTLTGHWRVAELQLNMTVCNSTSGFDPNAHWLVFANLAGDQASSLVESWADVSLAWVPTVQNCWAVEVELAVGQRELLDGLLYAIWNE